MRLAAVTILAAALAVVCLSALTFRGGGGRWFVVRTPSMGRAAPVGTLLLTRPSSVHALHTGQIISFRAPHTRVVYTHRVVATEPGGVRTRGDLNVAADPWLVTDTELIGRVSARCWGLGWVVRGLPLLLIGLGVVWLVSAFTRVRWRSPVRVVGTALSVSLVGLLLHPWVGLDKLGQNAGPGGVTIRAVSTGVLPIQVRAVRGSERVRLVNGQAGSVLVRHQDVHGAYSATARPQLSLWWWVAVIAFCLSPLLWCLLVGLARVPDEVGTSETAEGAG